MKNFKNITTIKIDDESSWSVPIFLSIDIDWAHDDVLIDTIDIVEATNVAATWFVTHDTPVLKRLRSNTKFEIGIHPNFNFLLEGDRRNGGNFEEVINPLFEFAPHCRVVRSHSVTQSSKMTQLFYAKGITHESNDYIPASSDIILAPWRLENGMTKTPYMYSDELACCSCWTLTIAQMANRLGLKVFDFHPIHIFLNTENLDRYERTRPLHQNPKELIKHRYDGYGTRSRLLELLALAKDS